MTQENLNPFEISQQEIQTAAKILGLPQDEVNVDQQLEKIMAHTFHDVYRTSQKHKVDVRTAAYILAVDRVASGTRVRGLFP
jgi:glutamate dehydrogenase/leucine dehydrogenase